MGILGAVFQGVSRGVNASRDLAKKVSNDSYVKKFVRDMVDQMTETYREQGEKWPEMAAARVAEPALLDQVGDLLDQAHMDGRTELDAPTIKRLILETIRDIKLTAWEADGCVNPADALAIRAKAQGLKTRVRTMMMIGRGAMGRREMADSTAMDMLEDGLIVELRRQTPPDHVSQNRVAQAAVYAVAELRIQQLAR